MNVRCEFKVALSEQSTSATTIIINAHRITLYWHKVYPGRCNSLGAKNLQKFE